MAKLSDHAAETWTWVAGRGSDGRADRLCSSACRCRPSHPHPQPHALQPSRRLNDEAKKDPTQYDKFFLEFGTFLKEGACMDAINKVCIAPLPFRPFPPCPPHRPTIPIAFPEFQIEHDIPNNQKWNHLQLVQ